MSPKQAILSAFLAFMFTLTVSSTNNCPDFDSVSSVLLNYDIPTGLFPGNVKSFSCSPINNHQRRLSIQLFRDCNVTRTVLFVQNIVQCKQDISATISYRSLSNIIGVTVTLAFRGTPVGELMTVQQATVVDTPLGKFLQFNSDKGPSPYFPLNLIPNVAPLCDLRAENKKDKVDEVYNGRPFLRLVA